MTMSLINDKVTEVEAKVICRDHWNFIIEYKVSLVSALQALGFISRQNLPGLRIL